MKEPHSDSDIIIDVLEEAAKRSFSDDPPELKHYGPKELPVVIDLIDSGKVRGDTGHVDDGLAVVLEGITLEGRQLRDELIEKRKAKSWTSRMKRIGLVTIGWIGGLVTAAVTEGIKALIQHFLK